MKKKVLFVAVVSAFAASVLLANGKTNKSHLNMKGKDDAKINCVYCHDVAKVPKKKKLDLKQFESSPYCGGKGCHPVPPKK